MVAIDEELSGIKMCLRPSMEKFQGRDEEFALIEIAHAFDRPNYSCGSYSLSLPSQYLIIYTDLNRCDSY